MRFSWRGIFILFEVKYVTLARIKIIFDPFQYFVFQCVNNFWLICLFVKPDAVIFVQKQNRWITGNK